MPEAPCYTGKALLIPQAGESVPPQIMQTRDVKLCIARS